MTYGALGPENRHYVGRTPISGLAPVGDGVVVGRLWPELLPPAPGGGGPGGESDEEIETGEGERSGLFPFRT